MFTPTERETATAIAALNHANPFTDAYAELEREALGVPHGFDPERARRISERALALVERAARGRASVEPPSAEDISLYEGLVRYHLFDRLQALLQSLTEAAHEGALTKRRVSSYKLFVQEATRLSAAVESPLLSDLPHLFALLYQRYRAKQLIESRILGTSRAVAELRAAMWQSIFTRDMARHERVLYRQVGLPSLIIGPCGSGKALVAELLSQARYIAFDVASLRFVEEPTEGFYALHGSSLEAELEAELFAPGQVVAPDVESEVAGSLSAGAQRRVVFLDEVGGLSLRLQAKLLSALQCPASTSAGEPQRQPTGKLIVASQYDLSLLVRDGSFRYDLYVHLHADVLHPPALSTQLRQAPEDLSLLVAHQLQSLLPPAEIQGATSEVVHFIEHRLPQHGWPGNMDELAQCARAVVMRGSYQPPLAPVNVDDSALSALGQRFMATDFSADTLLDAYCTLMYKRTGSYQEAARRLGLDRRTVKSHVDESILAEFS